MVDDPIFIVFDIAAVVVLAWWLFRSLAPTHHFLGQWRWRSALLSALGLSLAAIYFVLTTWASFDVVDSTFYVVGYLSLGLIWISISSRVLSSFADIRLQQDVRDRNNLAAAVAIGGLQVGSAVAYAGGNIGDGPGFHVVVFSALLSTFDCVRRRLGHGAGLGRRRTNLRRSRSRRGDPSRRSCDRRRHRGGPRCGGRLGQRRGDVGRLRRRRLA